jgi:hypothetical protein
MGRARCAQGACAFGISGNGAARLPKEMGQTRGNKNNQACDSPLLDRDGELHGVIALLALERAHVETRPGRLNVLSLPSASGALFSSFIVSLHTIQLKRPISGLLSSFNDILGARTGSLPLRLQPQLLGVFYCRLM